MKFEFKNHIVEIDKKDIYLFNEYNWYIHKAKSKTYLRGYKKGKRSQGLVYIHQLILPDNKEIDHKDGNGLNNSRKNLRPCSRSQNNANRIDKGRKGVYFDTYSGKYKAEIHYKNKKYSLGRYSNFKEAKAAYNTKSKELFKEFSRTAL